MLATTLSPLAGRELTYSRSVFEAILSGMGWDDPSESPYVCTDAGVRLKHLETNSLLGWHPLCEVMEPGSPNPLDEPWLPFPFTARQLAALMTYGYGYFIQEKYGEWEDGPDEGALLSIGVLGGKAKEVLTDAYMVFRHAVAVAPRLERDLEVTASELASQYDAARETAIAREKLREHRACNAEYRPRLARVNAAVAGLEQPMREARRAADEDLKQWRRAVVQYLLSPIEAIPLELINVAEESESQRQQRRLVDLRRFGGDCVQRGGVWRAKDRQSGAFRRLVEQERSNGSRNFSEKSVREDLRDAAKAEAADKRSGAMVNGLVAP